MEFGVVKTGLNVAFESVRIDETRCHGGIEVVVTRGEMEEILFAYPCVEMWFEVTPAMRTTFAITAGCSCVILAGWVQTKGCCRVRRWSCCSGYAGALIVGCGEERGRL